MRGRFDRRLALGLLAASACAAFPAAASASNGNYVAMGDSYTAGPGLLPYEEGAPAGCARSADNYPHQVAKALNLSLTDVSCSGAKTEDEEVSQLEGQAPQDDALSESTQVVSLGMGGNDGNLFGTLLQGCSETDTTTPGKAPCKAKYEGFVTSTFASDKAPEEAALVKIKELAPHATVFVVGYPEIAPAHGVCPLQIPWTEGDLKWFRSKVEKAGNKMIKVAAKANGAIFVETFKPSEGHNACQAVGTRWIEPLIAPLTGVPVHPNALGQENDSFDVEQSMLTHGVR